jgi:predicted Kef-type K+ transport protein
MLNILHETEFIIQVAELGVIVLMFTAGLETDYQGAEKGRKGIPDIAVCGVLVPLAGGFAVAYFFNRGNLAEPLCQYFSSEHFYRSEPYGDVVKYHSRNTERVGKAQYQGRNAILELLS